MLRSEGQNHYSGRRDDRDSPEERRYQETRNYSDRRQHEGRQENGVVISELRWRKVPKPHDNEMNRQEMAL